MNLYYIFALNRYKTHLIEKRNELQTDYSYVLLITVNNRFFVSNTNFKIYGKAVNFGRNTPKLINI